VRLHALSPASRLQKEKQSLNFAIERLKRAMHYKVEKDSNRLASAASTLNAISPLQTLGRGYSITTSGDGRALTDTSDITKDEVIRTRLHKGQLTSRVIEIMPDIRPGDKD
jgi:exodeoxyribonuclease VII large subunit